MAARAGLLVRRAARLEVGRRPLRGGRGTGIDAQRRDEQECGKGPLMARG
jgi:hypothetical protein